MQPVRRARATLAHRALAAARSRVAQVVGVFKDWVVIIVSSVVFESVVQPMQWVGYSVAFVGIALYVRYKYTQHLDKGNGAPADSQPLLDFSDSMVGSSIGLMSEESLQDLEGGDEDSDDSSPPQQWRADFTTTPAPSDNALALGSLVVTLPTASQAAGVREDAPHDAPIRLPRISGPPEVPALPALLPPPPWA